jgi:hypothetical protein
MKKSLLIVSSFLASFCTFAQESRVDVLTQKGIYGNEGFLHKDLFLTQTIPSRVFDHGTVVFVNGPKIANNLYGNYGHAGGAFVKNNFAIGGYMGR